MGLGFNKEKCKTPHIANYTTLDFTSLRYPLRCSLRSRLRLRCHLCHRISRHLRRRYRCVNSKNRTTINNRMP